ncbi:MAG: ROK family transcriptional regulator [Pseudomonadota bacterium]
MSDLTSETQKDRGSNQASLRAYNERLVLSLVRRQGGLAKADIARSTGLSAQTVSIIMRGLEADGLLIRGTPIKGKVGQPSVPMHLASDGAYSIGLKIGRRSADLALMNFVGEIQHQIHHAYPYPMPDPIIDFATNGVEQLLAKLPKKSQQRIAGIGIATPFELWNWAEQVRAPADEMAAWRGFDLAEALGHRSELPIFVQNDATAACGAELIVGRGADHADFIYFFVGYFVGGGVVLNNAVYVGPGGNAGALGPLPMPATQGKARQLVDDASTFVLEAQLEQQGLDPSCLWNEPHNWSGFDELLNPWIQHTAQSLAHAIVASCAVIDFPVAIIDGAFPEHVRHAIVTATTSELAQFDLRGLQPPAILEGSVGANARVVGGALLPFFERYLTDQDLLFKSPA